MKRAAGSAKAAAAVAKARAPKPAAAVTSRPKTAPIAEVDESAKTRRFTSPSSDQIEAALHTTKGLSKWWPVPAALLVAGVLIFAVIEAKQAHTTPSESQPATADEETANVAAVVGTEEEVAQEEVAQEEVAQEEVAEEEVAQEEVAEEEVAEEEVAEEPDPEPEPPVMATIRVDTVPATATLTMDGARVANPYSIEVEQTDSRRLFEASADGYESASIAVALSSDQSETLRLEATPPPRPAVSQPARDQPTMRRSARTRPRPATRPRTRRPNMRRQNRGTGFVSDNPY